MDSELQESLEVRSLIATHLRCIHAKGDSLGTTAAAAQAGIGNVVAGSVFATLTSAGAGGAALATIQGVAGGAVGLAVLAARGFWG